MLNRVRITKRTTFEAAHHIPNHYSKCANIHGHSYKLEVTISGLIEAESLKNTEPNINPQLGMVLDFSSLKQHMEIVTAKYDHTDLNTYFSLPTAEVMAVTIFNDLVKEFDKYAVKVESVKLWETEDSYAEYRGEEE